MNIKIIPALREHEQVLANLIELYAHDFSEFVDLKLGADGRFGYESLPLYWQEPDRYPFLIMVDNELAGFLFVRRGSQISDDRDVWDMTEFFVARGFRRLGIGTQAAHTVWRKFPGKWQVRVINRNQPAKEFWERAIAEFAGQPIAPTSFEKSGAGWHLFSFES